MSPLLRITRHEGPQGDAGRAGSGAVSARHRAGEVGVPPRSAGRPVWRRLLPHLQGVRPTGWQLQAMNV